MKLTNVKVPEEILGKFTYEIVSKWVERSNHVSDIADLMKCHCMSEQEGLARAHAEAWTFFKEMREACAKYEFVRFVKGGAE